MEKDKKERKKSVVISVVLGDRRLVDTVFDSENNQTRFAVWKNGKTEIVENLGIDNRFLVPISAHSPLLKNKLVCFPSEPVDYGNIQRLLREIQSFIHAYVDLSKEFEKIASYYVLLTWVYDSFSEIPYLRKIGDFGSGKTRFLKVLGSICYKGTFASGGTSTAALFHIIDKFKGTLIVDEADFVFSDEKSAVAKILNNGNAAGFPILRVSQDSKGKFTPISYDVYCPKIIASRGNYSDQALESRFITETFRPIEIRKDIPTTLPESFEQKALKLRNKLLFYRFENLFKIKKYSIPESMKLEGRIRQIFTPLLSVVNDQNDRKLILSIAEKYSEELKNERSQNIEAQVLSIIKKLSEEKENLSIKNITTEFFMEYGDYYQRKITAKWIGFIVRKRLNLSTYKSDGIFIIDPSSHHLLPQLYIRYGV